MLLDYWQEGKWRCRLNHLPLTPDISNTLRWAPYDEIALGKISHSTLQNSPALLWVAPFVFKNANHEIWIPLWLPAQCEAGTFRLRTLPTLPWIPLSQFESCPLKNIFVAPAFDFIQWCLNEFFTDNRECAFTSWEAFYQGAETLLNTLSQGEFQRILQTKGYERSSEGAYFEQVTHDVSMNPLLQRYTQIEDEEDYLNVSLEENECVENAPLFCAKHSDYPSLSKHEYDCVLQSLMLSNGAMLTMETPWGANKEGVLDAIVNSKIVYAAIHEQPLPTIYRLAPHRTMQERKPCRSLTKASKDTVERAYQDMLSGLNLGEQLCVAKENDECVDYEIADIQAQDEALQKQFETVLEERKEAKKAKKTLKQRWQEWFHVKTCPFAEKIHHIKRQQAKLSEQLVRQARKKSAYYDAKQYWKDWCQAQGITFSQHLNLSEQIREAHQAMAVKILTIASHSFQQTMSTIEENERFVSIPGWGLYQWCPVSLAWKNVPMLEEAELLIIDDANQLHPQQIASLLSKANRAIFLGNSQDYQSNEIIDGISDEYLLLNYPELESDCHEQLHYKGMLLSTGNAFTVALRNSHGQNLILNEVGKKHPTLIEFCNGFHQTKLISPLPFVCDNEELSGLHFIEIAGQSYAQGQEKINPMEAKAIQDWVSQRAFFMAGKTKVIITLYDAQVDLLKGILRDQNLNIEIYTLQTLPHRCWDYVIFSSVLTSRDPRPYVFDQNDTFFYSIVARARLGVWIVGDKGLFNSSTHSPSGKLSKFIQKSCKKKSLEML